MQPIPKPIPIVQPIFDQPLIQTKLTGEELCPLCTFTVPEVVEDGTCSRAPAKELFNLTTVPSLVDVVANVESFDTPTPITLTSTSLSLTHQLQRLKAVIAELYRITRCDWLGIYQLFPNMHVENGVQYPGLVKLAYDGEFSRAIFPLSPYFLETSNNT